MRIPSPGLTGAASRPGEATPRKGNKKNRPVVARILPTGDGVARPRATEESELTAALSPCPMVVVDGPPPRGSDYVGHNGGAAVCLRSTACQQMRRSRTRRREGREEEPANPLPRKSWAGTAETGKHAGM